jgi:hypothetical protein
VDALGAERSCFSLAPRWLGPPNEMVCTLAARADVPWDPDNILVAHMTSTAKCFSTAWVSPCFILCALQVGCMHVQSSACMPCICSRQHNNLRRELPLTSEL